MTTQQVTVLKRFYRQRETKRKQWIKGCCLTLWRSFIKKELEQALIGIVGMFLIRFILHQVCLAPVTNDGVFGKRGCFVLLF